MNDLWVEIDGCLTRTDELLDEQAELIADAQRTAETDVNPKHAWVAMAFFLVWWVVACLAG